MGGNSAGRLSDDETALMQLTEEEIYEEALKHPSAAAWREFEEGLASFGFAETSVPADTAKADIDLWYETAWEWARERRERREAAESEILGHSRDVADAGGMDAAEADRAWIRAEAERPGRLEEFLRKVRETDRIEAWQPMDEEDRRTLDYHLGLKEKIQVTLGHGSWLSNAKRVADGGLGLTEPTRKRLTTLMRNNPRDYRSLWAEIMEQPEWAVKPSETAAAELKKRLGRRYVGADPERLSPEKIKRLLDGIEDEKISREMKRGGITIDNAKVERYIRILEERGKESGRRLRRLEAKIEAYLSELNDPVTRELVRQYEDMLKLREAAESADIAVGELKKKGIEPTAKYMGEAAQKRHNADTAYNKVMQALRNERLKGDIREALALEDAAFKIRNEIRIKQKDARILRSVRQTKIRLAKRIQRRLSLDTVNYEQAELVLALQQIVLPMMKRGVNRWIGTEGSLLQSIHERFNTDSIFRARLKRRIVKVSRSGEIMKRGEAKWGKIEKIMGGGYEDMKTADRRFLLSTLPIQDIAAGDDEILKNYYTLYRSDADFREKQGGFISEKLWREKKFEELTVKEKTEIALGIPDEKWSGLLDWDKRYKDRQSVMPLDLNETRDESGELSEVSPGEELEARLKAALPATLWRRVKTMPYFADWTIEQAAELNEAIDDLYQEGKEKLAVKRETERRLWKSYREQLIKTVKTAGLKVADTESAEGKEKIRRLLKKYDGGMTGAEVKIKERLIPRFFFENGRRIFRSFDGDDDNGIFSTLLIWEEDEVFNNEMKRRFSRMEKVNGKLAAAGAEIYELYANKFTFDNFYTDGGGLEITLDAALHILAAGENERSRMAVMYGSMLTQEERAEAYNLAEDDPDITRFANLGEGRFLRIKAAAEEFLRKPENEKFTAVKEAVMTDYDEQHPRMNEMSIRVYNKPVFKEDNYTPINRTQGTGELPESKLAAEARAASGTGVRAYHDSGAFKSRIDIGMPYQTPIQLGLYRTWVGNVETNEHAIAVAEYEKTLNNVFAGKDPDTQALRKAVADRYGKSALKFIEGHIKTIIKPDPVRNESALEKMLPFLRGNTALAYLAFNLQSIVTQAVTSPAPFFQYMSMGEYAAAAAEYAKDKEALDKFIDEKSPHMKARQANLAAEAVREATETAETPLKAKYNKAARAGMAGLELIDRAAVAPGWLAVYRREAARLWEENKTAGADALTEEEIDREAVRLADDVVRLTQPSGRKADLPPLFREGGTFVRAFLQFQASLSVVFQNIFVDMPYFARTGRIDRIARGLAAYAASGLILGLVTGGFDDEDDGEEKARKAAFYALSQFTGSVPVIGSLVTNAAEAALTGRVSYMPSYNVLPVADKAGSAFMSVVTALNADTEEKMRRARNRALASALEAAGIAASLPVSADKKAARAAGAGDGDGEAAFNPGALIGWK
jgi:hypothetical protein